MKIKKLVSGAQTGADHGGLDAAIHLGLPYGGWIPKGRRADDVVVPAHYKGLRETAVADYRCRTELNVVESDATVVFTYGNPRGGSLQTINFANKRCRPNLHVDLRESTQVVIDKVVQWLETVSTDTFYGTLNVAGSRECNAEGIQQKVMLYLIAIIPRVNIGEL